MKGYTPRRAALERWLEDAPEYILDVFDNKGKTVDRYTVLFTGPLLERDASGEVRISYLGLSEAPTHPQGFSQWGELNRLQAVAFRRAERHQRIRWLDLPERLRRHVIARATQSYGDAQSAAQPARERQR